MNKLRIAILHLQIQWGNTCLNRKLLACALSIAAGYGANLVVTGELIESGEDFWKRIYLNSIPGNDYPFLSQLEEMARQYELNILFGRAYRMQRTGQIFSTYTHINDEGQIQAVYEKQVAESEEEAQLLTQGDELVITDIACLKVGLLLGYNEATQEIIEEYDQEGVDLIIGGLTPLRHPCGSTQVNTRNIEIPILLSNYNLIKRGKLYQGESLAIATEGYIRFCPICSEVIILDYLVDCESFEVVNRINVNQTLCCR